MVKVIFLHNNDNFIVKSYPNDLMKEIIQEFLTQSKIDADSVVFLYEGNKINEELELETVITNRDLQQNSMNIIVKNLNELDENKADTIIKSKDVICPDCGENCIIKINDYIISLSNCNNEHKTNGILLNEYEETQNIDISNITCDKCKGNNKKRNNNIFFFCISCKKYLCQSCYETHDKKHNIINYEKIDYICHTHYEPYNKFCNECRTDLCPSCDNIHKSHNNVLYENIMPDIDKIKDEINELRKLIDNFKNEIQDIIDKLNKEMENMEIYYNIYNDMINNYENKNINYNLIQNIKLINNNSVMKDINQVIAEKNIINKFKYLMNIYNKMIGKNARINKKGIIHLNNGDRYEGDYKNDKREGKGIYCWKDGSKYEGDWKNSLKEGKGIYIWKDGDKYEGDYKNDKREGKGIMHYNSGKWEGDLYEGEWKNDKKEGKGIYCWKNGDRYEGDYKNDKREGRGICFYNFGERYEGDWKNDKRDGKGTYFYNKGKWKGDRYEGEWKNGLKEGNGIYYFKNGDKQVGNYLKGNLIGEHIIYHANGEITSKNY